jgi:serine/threonine protein phosphatase PrpC
MKSSIFGCTHIGGKDVNQDTFFHATRPNGSIYAGVFDGHCKYGKEVADAVCAHFKAAETLESAFAGAEEAAKKQLLCEAEKAGVVAEEKADKTIFYRAHYGLEQILQGGTTATAVETVETSGGVKLRVGHVGDSEVMVIHADTGKFTVLTNDHSSTSIAEYERVLREAADPPRVDFAFMTYPRPVFVRDSASAPWKINPIGGPRVCNIRRDWSAYLHGKQESLNMMRAVGDFSLKKHGVSAQADFLEHTLPPGRNIILVASDGLYDNYTYEGLRDMVLQEVTAASGKNATKDACRAVLDRGVQEGFKNFGKKSQDNTTVVLAVVEVMESAESFLTRTNSRRC